MILKSISAAAILMTFCTLSFNKKISSSSYFSTPKEGVTDFNNLYHNTFIDLTGIKKANGAGLLASDVAGYNFRLYSNSSATDFGIGIEDFTGETALVYGYSQNASGPTTAFEISSNGDKYFDLKSVDIAIDNDGSNQSVPIQLTGYKDGTPVAGAVLTINLKPASYGGILITFNVSTNAKFVGIDMFRISGSNLYAIAVDNINAVNFRSAPLPLTLTYFSGSFEKDKAVLTWRTANEQNTKSFDIERSANGIDFETTGNVKAANNTGMHQYIYSDKDVSALGSPVVFYRLKQKDIDGHFSYSDVIKISGVHSAKGISLYPNPATNETTIYFNLNHKEEVRIKITDNTGKTVRQLKYKITGATRLPIDLSTLPKGIYFAEIKGNTIQQVLQFAKQ